MALGGGGKTIDQRVQDRDARAACTRPRWRSGSASAASRGRAPSTGMPSAAMASATSARWRSLATRFRITPATCTAAIVRGKAAHDRRRRLRLPRHVEDQHDRQAEMRGEIGGRAAPAAPARRRRRTGPSRLRSPRDRRSRAACAASASSRSPGIAQESRLTLAAPGDRGMEGRIDVVRSGFRGAHANAAPPQAPRAAASVTVVLPAPECGAAMMSPRAVTFFAAPPARAAARARSRCRRSPRSPAARVFVRGRRRRACPASR